MAKTWMAVNTTTYGLYFDNLEFRHAQETCDFRFPDGSLVAILKRTKKYRGQELFYDHCRLFSDETHLIVGGPINKILRFADETESLFALKMDSYELPFKSEFNRDDALKLASYIKEGTHKRIWLALGAPKQEIFAAKLKKELSDLNLDVHIYCIGAVMDYVVGSIPEVPRIFLKMHLEWLWRLLHDPRRILPRITIGLVQFMYYYWISGKTILRLNVFSSK